MHILPGISPLLGPFSEGSPHRRSAPQQAGSPPHNFIRFYWLDVTAPPLAYSVLSVAKPPYGSFFYSWPLAISAQQSGSQYFHKMNALKENFRLLGNPSSLSSMS